MKLKNSKPIIIVAGEPNSIFLEIFFKCLKKNKFKRPILLIVSSFILKKQMSYLKYNFKINEINSNFYKEALIDKKKINFIDVNYVQEKPFQKISSKSNEYINKSFNIGLKILNEIKCSGFINGPISKKHFLNFNYLGITEYLAHKSNIKEIDVVMLIFNQKLSVSPITTHLPVNMISKNLSKKIIIKKIKIINNFYKKVLRISPKIALTGLNPHCESSEKNSAEKKIIVPALSVLKKNKIKIFGPFPADTIFMKHNRQNYDVVIGMYHDQVLTPIKTLFDFEAINMTLGLPYLRISPDHGPNQNMMGKNKSSHQSLLSAIKFLDNNVL